ncbi:hypothetical protein SKAU_G00186340 [Synaphobranchus kaupii]|uniref:Uncharacterized protein n=1 Tax=Synaphobranchus kaupii TaxID=118154 RepID=A0A9Q1IX02_SYNKA|nr:hypothetical protein SKAU_G00186340 [Synaphobranchus kaupii]
MGGINNTPPGLRLLRPPTVIGQFHTLFFGSVRMFFLGVLGFAVYGNEALHFSCDPDRRELNLYCYNQFRPITPQVFWALQLVTVLVPGAVFHLYAACKNIDQEEILQRPKYTVFYIITVLLRIILEVIAFWLQSHLFGFQVHPLYTCDASALEKMFNVTKCMVPEHFEKTIFLSAMYIFTHHLRTAQEHEKRDPVVAYYCRLYAMQTGMKLDSKTPECRKFLVKLMDQLETMKTELTDNESISQEIVGNAHIENYALKMFLYADNEDRSGRFHKNMIKSFYTASLLLDVLCVFGELSEENVQHRKYARWKATYIHNCLKNGETPQSGPIGMEGEAYDDEFGDDGGISLPAPTLPANTPAELPPPTDPVKPVPAPRYAPAVDPSLLNANQEGDIRLTAEDFTRAQKYCKYAGSALQYEDVGTAIQNLQKALKERDNDSSKRPAPTSIKKRMMSYISGGWWRWKFRNVLLFVLVLACVVQTLVLSCQVDCNQVLTAPLGSFTSPCYPGDYPKSLACKWTLQAPAGFIVQLTFADFELEEAPGCIYDRVVVSAGSNDVKFCGVTANGLTLNSTGNVMELSFISDFSIQKKGFNITYRQVAVALRNQKLRLPLGHGKVARASPNVTLPTLHQFTICFEISRRNQKNQEKIFSYAKDGSDILTFGTSTSETALNINSVQCALGTILNQSDFTQAMKAFCLTWASTSGRVAVYSNGYRTTSCTDSKHQTLAGGGVFSIGAEHDSFHGEVYNVRLWDYAMSRTQLTGLTCDVAGKILDWANSFWDIPSSHAQTDSSLSCSTAVPILTTLATSCASSGMGCPAKERDALRLMLLIEEAAAGMSTTPHTRQQVIAGQRSSKTSLGMISTPLIWPVRKKPDSLAPSPERPVIYLTKPPIPRIMGATNTSPKTEVATTLSVARKTNLMSKGAIHSEVALPWQPAGSKNASKAAESFQVASLSNRKNKPLAPHWALTASTENSTMNWTESVEYPSGVEPFIYDIELGEEPFGLYDFESPNSLGENLAAAVYPPDSLSTMSHIAESQGEGEKPLINELDSHFHWDQLAGDSARRPPSDWMLVHPFDGVPGWTGVQTDPLGPSAIGTPIPDTSAHVLRGKSTYQTAGPWTLTVPSRGSMLSDYAELSTRTLYNRMEAEAQTEAPLASSSEGQLSDQTAGSTEHFSSLKKYSPSAVSEAASPFPPISDLERERGLLRDSAHARPSQTDMPHLRSSEAILTPATKIQSDLLITEASRLHPLSLSRLTDFFLAFTHGSVEIRHSSSHKGYGDLVLPSLTEQFKSTERPHIEDSKSALPVDAMPSAQGVYIAVIMSATSGGSRLDSSLVLEHSHVNVSPKALLSSLKGHYSSPSDSDIRWLTHSGHISVSDITELPHKATAAIADKLPAFQSSPVNAVSKTREGRIDILPTFSIPPHLSKTGFLHERLFSELGDNASVIAEQEKPQELVASYLTEAHLNGSQSGSGSVSQTPLLQPSYSGTVASQSQNTWQGTSHAHGDDFTYLSGTKPLPTPLNPSPTPLEPHHVNLSEHGGAFSHEAQGSPLMSSLNMTSLHSRLGSVTHPSTRDFLSELRSSMTFGSSIAVAEGSEWSSDHAVTRPPHSAVEEPISHPTPTLELTLFLGAEDMVGKASGATQPNEPMGLFRHTSAHVGSQQWSTDPTGPHEEPSRPIDPLETEHAELPNSGSEPFSDGKPKESSPDDELLSASSQPFSATDSSTSAVTWKSSTAAQTTPSQPEADLSHSSHSAATDQSFVPTKGPSPLFTPPRGVIAANGSLPTRATNGISPGIPELAMCQ